LGSQEKRTKIGTLKQLCFFGPEIWCKTNPMIYGCARVSTDGQSVDAQVRQLTKAGCKKRCSAKWLAAQRPTARSFADCLTI
jgi:hypothetical protein